MVLSNAKWIGILSEVSAPEIQKNFNVKGVKSALLTITGYGFFDVKINGKKVTDYMFLPVASDFEPRDLADGSLYYKIDGTGIHPRTYYYEFDVSTLLTDGENVLSVRLGRGWNSLKGYDKTLKTIFAIDVKSDFGDSLIVSDGTEVWTDTEIRYNNIYTGEIIDYGAVSGKFNKVDLVSTPNTTLSKAIGTPDKIIRKLPAPRLIKEIDGRKIFDLGESISGLVKIKTHAKKGEQIILSFTELLNDNNDLLFNFGVGAEWAADNGPQIMKDIYISDGVYTEYFPTFTWHAFRYFDIKGEYDDFEVYEIHSDTPVTSNWL